jgi:hypothetical protein
MQQVINDGGVKKVSTRADGDEGCHLVSVFIHHELTQERADELAHLVERVALAAVGAWVKP